MNRIRLSPLTQSKALFVLVVLLAIGFLTWERRPHYQIEVLGPQGDEIVANDSDSKIAKHYFQTKKLNPLDKVRIFDKSTYEPLEWLEVSPDHAETFNLTIQVWNHRAFLYYYAKLTQAELFDVLDTYMQFLGELHSLDGAVWKHLASKKVNG